MSFDEYCYELALLEFIEDQPGSYCSTCDRYCDPQHFGE